MHTDMRTKTKCMLKLFCLLLMIILLVQQIRINTLQSTLNSVSKSSIHEPRIIYYLDDDTVRLGGIELIKIEHGKLTIKTSK